MSTNQPLNLALWALIACSTACRGPLPCDDCEVGDEQEEDGMTPDLPCGGADLMTDNDNCGACENECALAYEGTQWEAGTCQAGECGPQWAECRDSFANYSTCEEVCEAIDRECVVAGCSGLTALLIDTSPLLGCELDVNSGPDDTMTGACNEPISWEPHDDMWLRNVMCCCK